MTATPAPSTIMVRPSAAAQRRTVLLSLIAVPFVLLSLSINRNLPPWVVALFVVVIAAAVAFTVLRMRRLRVEYGDGRYRNVSMYRTRDFTVADIRQVHTFTAFRQGMYTSPDLMVEGLDGRRIMRLPGMLWDVTLLAALAIEIQSRGIPLEAHQILVAILVGVGALVLVTVGIIIAFAVLASSSGLIT